MCVCVCVCVRERERDENDFLTTTDEKVIEETENDDTDRPAS